MKNKTPSEINESGTPPHQRHAAALYERVASVMDAIAPLRKNLLTVASMEGNESTDRDAVAEALGELESSVARLEAEGLRLQAQGDLLGDLLGKNDTAEPSDLLPGSFHDLEELIGAQRQALVALRDQVSETESTLHKPAAHEPEPQNNCGAVEIQDLSEFMLESPMPSVPVNASYYQRILEAAQSPEGHKRPIGSILLKAGLITARQLENALRHQQEGRKRPLGALLVDLGYATDTAIAQTIAAQLALPFVTLSQEVIKQDALNLVPLHLARRHGCFPVSVNESALYVAMANPLDLIALEDLRLVSSKYVRPCVASHEEITNHINRHYAGSVF